MSKKDKKSLTLSATFSFRTEISNSDLHIQTRAVILIHYSFNWPKEFRITVLSQY